MRTTFILATLILLLAGCTAAPVEYARCTLPYTRDAGLGVQVPGCHAWEIGPPIKPNAANERTAPPWTKLN